MTPLAERWPAHAHVPGRNARHAEDAFDAFRATVPPGADAEGLARCEAFRSGLRFLDAGYFWEAHEVLEPVWMALPEGGAERRLVQSLIQLANGRLKLRMGRPKAALRLAALARGLAPPSEGVPVTLMTVDPRALHRWIDELERTATCAL